MQVHRDEKSGRWIVGKVKNSHASYLPAFEKYLNTFDPFFVEAKKKSEFEFILTLLRVRGLSGPGWDTLETLEEAHKTFYKISKKFNDDNFIVSQYSLFLYGLILEASEPYEMFANLINIIKGDRFQAITFFPDYTDNIGKTHSQSPADKIAQLKSLAMKVRLNLDIFDEFFDNKLRNAVFHSDYTIWEHEIRIMHPEHNYARDEWHTLINRALAFFEALMMLYKFHVSEYKAPQQIKPHPDFSPDPQETCITLVRKDHGIIGLKDNFSKAEISSGHIPHRIGRFMPYEIQLIEKGIFLLPRNRVERINAILGKLPKFVSRFIVKKIRKYL
ncbi:MAG: hypothetical protein HY340_00440 [Candidatus Kerfeldbacteria bacterium]|nr:hypothetical protein [Candidatus Kerfeldbacteria bacterium]